MLPSIGRSERARRTRKEAVHVTDNSTRRTWIAIAAGGLLFVVFCVILWLAGFFDFSGSAESAKIVTSALALVGGLFGSIITSVSMLLKHSLDARNAALKSEAEDRLNLEAAIQAVKLFSTSSGERVPVVQRAGALFALSSLRRYELATNLTGELLSNDQLTASSAAHILNRALLSGERRVQHEAIGILEQNAEKMLTEGGAFEFPPCLSGWEMSLPIYVREWAMIALGRVLVARPRGEWGAFHVNGILAAYGLGWLKETEQRLKIDIGILLRSILRAYPDVGELYHPQRTIDIEQIRQDVESLPEDPVGAATVDVVRSIDDWMAQEDA